MLRLFISLIVSTNLFAAVAETPTFAKATKDLQDFDVQVTHLIAAFNKVPKAPGDKDWIKKKIQHMYDVDLSSPLAYQARAGLVAAHTWRSGIDPLPDIAGKLAQLASSRRTESRSGLFLKFVYKEL